MRRRRLTLGMLVGLAAVAFFGLVGSTSSHPATAADLSTFRAGNIISDAVFWDSGALSAQAIQTFLSQEGAACSGGTDGSPCIKNYVIPTASRAATTFCPGGYAGVAAGESAASIVWKVAQGCGVNPQVLLVTLQKEMGLIRTTNPTAKMYSRAMGYGCPDNTGGTCDSTYYGFQNQVYSAASQFRRYATNPTNYSYRAGITANILLNPNTACGTMSVYLENSATAALYNYTPYTPNQAALNAGYGLGDGCSSYGNRNFFAYFTDWFGSTQFTGSSAIYLKYQALGGPTSYLGDPISATICGYPAGGCGRAYQNGSIYWSPASGAAALSGDILYAYWNAGSVNGPWGYPTYDSGPVTGGTAAAFQAGSVYSSAATGTHIVGTELLQDWWATGGITGPLGYPIVDSQKLPGGTGGAFTGGSIYWSSATGAHWMNGDLRAKYWAMGNVSGILGYPITDQVAVSGGQAIAFTGGSVYTSAATGAHVVRGASRSAWWARGGITGPLGFPTGDTVDLTGVGGTKGQSGDFSGGTLYTSSATSPALMSGPVLAAYQNAGGPAQLGFPIADQVAEGVALQQASIYWSSGTGAHVVRGASRSAWWARGGINGPLGYPTADTVDVTGLGGTKGQAGAFSGGTLYTSSATSPALMSGPILAAYQAAGGPAQFGFPIVDQTALTGGQGTALQQASIYWSSGTGAHVVSGANRSAWWARGGITGPLGYPTADTVDVTGLGGTKGQVGAFSGGTLYTSSATPPVVLSGAVLAAYQAAGGPAQLGFPIADQVTEGVALQKASIYWSSGTGAHFVRGPALSAYWASGAFNGPLGYPTADTTDVTGNGLSGTKTTFSGGSIYETGTTGARIVRSSVDSIYSGAGGPASSYGWPVSDSVAVGAQWRNDFQNGSITG